MNSENIPQLFKAISDRKAIREYSDKPIPNELCDKIDAFISQINNEPDLFDSKTRFMLMRKDFSRIWTFGLVGGNKFWLCGCTNKDNEFSEAAFGYKMEKIILYICSLGLDTVWLGGTYTASCFTTDLKMDNEKEKLVCVSPVGYRSDSQGLISYFMKRKRNEWSKNFFYQNAKTAMTEDKCDFFTKEIIEAIRWLPTAVNRQDYAVVFGDKVAHVFVVGKSTLSLCDGGIAMAHVEVACSANGHAGKWEKVENLNVEQPENWRYLGSYVC